MDRNSHLNPCGHFYIDEMETVETLSDFFMNIGARNFLAIGIIVIVLWLLISGIRKGLKRGRKDEGSDRNEED